MSSHLLVLELYANSSVVEESCVEERERRNRSPYILWLDFVQFSVIPNVFTLLISLHSFPHVECIFAGLAGICCMITVVVLYNPKHTVAESPIEGDGAMIASPNEQVHEPCVIRIGSNLKLLHQDFANAQSSGLGSNSQGSNVGMPR